MVLQIKEMLQFKQYICKPQKASHWAWKYSSKYKTPSPGKKTTAVCDLCLEKRCLSLQRRDRELSPQEIEEIMASCEIKLGPSLAPSKIEQHINSYHKDIAINQIQSVAQSNARQTTLDSIITIKDQSTFADAYRDWVCETLQPINACEHGSFKYMCKTLSSKAPTLNRHSVRSAIVRRSAEVKEIVKV